MLPLKNAVLDNFSSKFPTFKELIDFAQILSSRVFFGSMFIKIISFHMHSASLIIKEFLGGKIDAKYFFSKKKKNYVFYYLLLFLLNSGKLYKTV